MHGRQCYPHSKRQCYIMDILSVSPYFILCRYKDPFSVLKKCRENVPNTKIWSFITLAPKCNVKKVNLIFQNVLIILEVEM